DWPSTFFFSSRRRHTRSYGDWSSDVCSSDLPNHHPEWLFALDLRERKRPWLLSHLLRSPRSRGARRRPENRVAHARGTDLSAGRSEERRVGKEWSARGGSATQ